MSDPTGRSPKARSGGSKRRVNMPPGKGGSESGRKTVGQRHGYMGPGREHGKGSDKNQGDGAGT